MTKVRNIMFTGIFLTIIYSIFVLHIVTTDIEKSELESRKLAKRPDFAIENFLSGNYSERFDNYHSDQFPMRDKWLEIDAFLHYKIFGRKVFDNVYISPDGYLITRVEKGTKKQVETIANRINKFARDMKKLGINTYTVILPNKSTMLEDKFPSYYPSYGNYNLNQIMKRLDPVTNFIDVRSTLEPHMNEYLFYYTDHHWQPTAAFYAYQHIMRIINQNEDLSEEIPSYDDYNWQYEGKYFYGSEARKSIGIHTKKPDRIIISTPRKEETYYEMKWNKKSRKGLYVDQYLEKDDPYTNRYQVYMGGDSGLITVYNYDKKNGKKILVLKDSYANAIIQFFARHYEEIHIIDLRHYKGIPIHNYVQKHRIDHVMILNNVNSIYTTPQLTKFD